MRWVNERLAIGDASDALGVRRLEEAGITGILSLDWFPISSPSPRLDWRKHTLIDGPGNSEAALTAAIDSLDELTIACHRVLVHCREGVSRSPFIVACHLATTSGRPLTAAIEDVRARVGWISINEGLLDTWKAMGDGGA